LKYPTEITVWASVNHSEYLQEDSYDEGLRTLTLLVATSGHVYEVAMG